MKDVFPAPPLGNGLLGVIAVLELSPANALNALGRLGAGESACSHNRSFKDLTRSTAFRPKRKFEASIV